LEKLISLLLLLLLIAFGFCFGLRFLDADNNKTFPHHQIEEISNLGACYDEIFQIVADKMGLEINENAPKPIILTNKQISLQKFNSYLGWDSEEVFPYYFSNKNMLVIPLWCKLDTLAHELVHYFQVMYRNEDLNVDHGLYTESLEMEAVAIQRWFKANYLGITKSTTVTLDKFAHQVFAIL
jgi:hypothetical protein